MTPYQAKIIPPRLRRVIHRERLFRLLDDLGEYPVTWISSPAGSGKTTLVASYAQAREIPVLWYRVDEADHDVSSFFFFMREAAGRLKKGRTKPLPLFTPEYRPGIATFTRRYFESLFGKMPVPGMIVFDNYQDVPEDSEIHEVIRNGLKLTPEGIRVFVVSRREPPSPFVSLKAESMLGSMSWDEVRFTLDEVREMIRLRAKQTLSEEEVRRVHEETQGWAAAVILAADGKEAPALKENSIGHSSIFDYFSVEVFDRLEQRIKHFLLMTVLLPAITPEIAAQLTGLAESATILDDLSRNHFFTERYGREYRYHPLFREFLLSTAEKSLPQEEILAARRKAGRLLLESGQRDEAIDLLTAAQDWEALIPAILGEAQMLVAEGRGKTLEKWITTIPEEVLLRTPWLLYWEAVCKREYDPVGSSVLFERAFNLFQENGEATGMLLAWSGVVVSITGEYRDLQRLDKWIEWFDSYMRSGATFPSPEIESMVAGAMASALMIRKPHHPDFRAWTDRTLTSTRLVTDPVLRALVFLQALWTSWTAYMWLGDHARWAEAVREAEKLAKSGKSFLTVMWYTAQIALLNETRPGHESSLALTEESLRFAEETGMIAWTPIQMAEGFYSALYKGDSRRASEFLKKQESAAEEFSGIIHIRYHACASLYHLLAGDTPQAVMHGEELLRHSKETGGFYPEAAAHLYLAFIFLEGGRSGEARDHLAAFRAMPETPSLILKYTWLMAEAGLALHEERPEAPGILKEALELGRREGYVGLFYWWQPSLMVRLCKAALRWGIEVEYVRNIIRSRNLVPEEPPSDLETWPWPVKVFTIGGFRIQVDDKPLVFTGKIQKRPLGLLKALIALGGKDVRPEVFEDLLWPEADGDMARIAFKTALSRLRKLLGKERAVEIREGKLCLDRQSVWLDTWALDNLAERTSRLSEMGRPPKVEEVGELASLALHLYRGEFLNGDDEPWITPYRDGFKNRFLKTVKNLGEMLRDAGEARKVTSLYERATERGLSLRELEEHTTRLTLVASKK